MVIKNQWGRKKKDKTRRREWGRKNQWGNGDGGAAVENLESLTRLVILELQLCRATLELHNESKAPIRESSGLARVYIEACSEEDYIF